MKPVRHIYIPIKREYKSNKGLAERLVKKRLEAHGWIVWRGSFVNALKMSELYPNVRRKYALLTKLLFQTGRLDDLQYLTEVHHGMPDFICFKDYFKFIECKLGHEQLAENQKKCIAKLQELGFIVEVHKIVFPCTKLRRAYIDLETGKTRILEKQARLLLRYPKHR